MAELEIERSICFVDLAGFTALTEAHGDKEALGVIDGFTSVVRGALGVGDELVKSIGDAVMIASQEPSSALSMLSDVFAACEETAGFPLLRAGVHHGRVLARGGDYFGATVNVAARVAALAGGGQVLVTSPVAEVARHQGCEVIALGPHRLRNLSEQLDLFQVQLRERGAVEVVDPVCHMRVAVDEAAGTLHHEGTGYSFCSLACVARFAEDPARFMQ